MYLEVECLFSHCNVTPEDACKDKQFCCAVQVKADGSKEVVLKWGHLYFAQVQGQIAEGEQPCSVILLSTQLKGSAFSEIYLIAIIGTIFCYLNLFLCATIVLY